MKVCGGLGKRTERKDHSFRSIDLKSHIQRQTVNMKGCRCRTGGGLGARAQRPPKAPKEHNKWEKVDNKSMRVMNFMRLCSKVCSGVAHNKDNYSQD